MDTYTLALGYLRQALENPQADFRSGQWESIEQLLARKRALVVERTGWGKSMVYFLATRLLRDSGAGPTLLISPLLSLMRNQIEAAERIGIRAETINSTNKDDWGRILDGLNHNSIDILLISPERLGNPSFKIDTLDAILNSIGLLVIDEAHCISDWGHDFRPDYRRIVRIVNQMPTSVPILATTATANNRVVKDVQAQLGNDIIVQRGPLIRKSLMLQNINMPDHADRLAYLAQTIPQLPGSGIVYTLTQRDAIQVAEWLNQNQIIAKAYHASIQASRNEIRQMEQWLREDLSDASSERLSGLYKEFLEQSLLGNHIKVLVATVALGMGFDKPDLGFVIHYQRPSSVVHYYQQVGRAGRGTDMAFGILLGGEEDDEIANFFIRSAFPPQKHVTELLTKLAQFPNGLSAIEMQSQINLRSSQIDKTLRFLTVEEPCPIEKRGTKWLVTPAAQGFQINQNYVEQITALRHQEQQQMQQYMQHKGCLMEFLQCSLDDVPDGVCGKCVNCKPINLPPETVDPVLKRQAEIFLRGLYQTIEPRKRWPMKQMFKSYQFPGENTIINSEIMMEPGYALCLWRDGGWGKLVEEGINANHFDDKLVDACVELIKGWNFGADVPKWVTAVPSEKNPERVGDFAQRLATALNLPFKDRIKKIRSTPPQLKMSNSCQQVSNLDGAFEVAIPPAEPRKSWAPCILVDDTVCSRWTLTLNAALLRQRGVRAVFPLALALRME